jgi:hypothetical protein
VRPNCVIGEMPGASHPIICHPIHPPCYPASAAWAARGRGHERGHGLRQTCSIAAFPGTERPNRECTTRPSLFVPYVQYLPLYLSVTLCYPDHPERVRRSEEKPFIHSRIAAVLSRIHSISSAPASTKECETSERRGQRNRTSSLARV